MMTTTAFCVGWRAEPRCSVNGEFHGCKLPEGRHRYHVCACSARIRAWSTRSRASEPVAEVRSPR